MGRVPHTGQADFFSLASKQIRIHVELKKESDSFQF